ncbi:MAG: hypothetical protein A3A51_04245 [Candidatus Levybacteria bacterium RIFCSPLOWO2_01_FULL_39_10]|nr:MAG: hypothetical protein A3A51_04245 [Candidatus Levybacteria bacterium RIFCSPLOWO2_01_FULL_39_10]
MLLAIPATIYLVKQQQDLRTQAVPNTTLSFAPSNQTAEVGDLVPFDIFVSPGNNQVSFIKLVIKYDSTLVSTTEDDFLVDPLSNLTVIQGPVVGTDEFSVVLTVQADPTKVIQQNTKIGTITFSVDAPSDVPTQISFDPNQIQISSIAAPDSFTENVFLNGTPATITIVVEGGLTPTPTATPSGTLTPTITVTGGPTVTTTQTPTPTIIGGAVPTPGTNEAPVCSNLLTDLGIIGVAPYTLIFTAEGSDSDGTIEKATFDFGDGTIEDILDEGGIGTSTVSVQRTHTYVSAGAFTANVILTDDFDSVSETASCSIDITVTDDSQGQTGLTATPSPTIAPPGPESAIVGIGVLGAILFAIGVILFFAL